MKRWIKANEEVFAMSKIVDKYAIKDIASDIGKFVYFSESNSSHGPRIKFYGGTKETQSTKDSPSLVFNASGDCEVEIADWMNKKNCPNAFDPDYIAKLERFVKANKSILLLVWFGHLDEADALAYFHGQITFKDLIRDIDYFIPDEITSLDELDRYCIASSFYRF